MLACQMSQSEEGMARIEAMCVLIFQFSIYFIIMDTVNCRFYTVIKICIAIEIERTLYEYVVGLLLIVNDVNMLSFLLNNLSLIFTDIF